MDGFHIHFSAKILFLLCNLLNISECLICTNEIRESILNYSGNVLSQALPYGRKYSAENFGVSFIFRNGTYSLSKFSSGLQNVYRGEIHMCSLSEEESHNLRHNKACNVSFYGRLIGREVIVGSIRQDYIERKLGGCYWIVEFHLPLQSGYFNIEIRLMWMNEMDEPTKFYSRPPSEERSNSGRIVHLGGTGEFPQYLISKIWLDYFTTNGPIILRRRGRYGTGAYWLILNNKRHMVENKSLLSMLGINPLKITDVPEQFLQYAFIQGEIFTKSKLNEYFNTIEKRNRIIITLPDMIKEELSQGWLFYGQEPMLESMVYNLPISPIYIYSSGDFHNKNNYNPLIGNKQERHPCQQNISRLSLPLCTNGDVKGRWVYESTCDNGIWASSPSKNTKTTNKITDITSSPSNLMNPIFGECSHSIPPPSPYPERSRGNGWSRSSHYDAQSMVWRPFDCRLAHHAVCEPSDISCQHRHNMTDIKRFQNPSTGNLSSLATCIRERGIGFIAGFGDSIGADIGRYISKFLDVSSFSTEQKMSGSGPANGSHAFGLVCGHASNNPSWDGYAHFLLNTIDLQTCIQESVQKMILREKDMELKFDKNNITPHSIPKKTTIVLVTNFQYSHALKLSLTMENITYYLQRQARVHADLAHRFQSQYGINYRRIFFSTAVLGHGFAGLTTGRVKLVTDLAREILVPTGWEILDSYNITLARPDGTTDGVHFRRGVALAVVDLLLTIICN